MSANFLELPEFGVASWKTSVATVPDLPDTGNNPGDAIAVQDSGVIYVWDGSTWQAQGGGGGGGSGTVTSVAMTVPSIMSVSGSPVTTVGTLAVSLANQSANRVFAGPTNGGATSPAFRALVAADVPTLNQNTTGSAATFTDPLAGDVTGTQGATVVEAINGTNMAALGTGILKNTTATGVPSIAIAADFPTLNQNTSGSAASFTGNLAGDVTGTQGATVVGKINGQSMASLATGIVKNTTATGVPSIAIASDFPTLNQNTTGTASGFTGNLAGDVTGPQATTVVGKINGVTMASLATGILKNTTATGVPSIAVAGDFPTLNQNTTGTASNVTGTVAVANGGSGQTSYTNGQLLIGDTTGNTLAKATLTAGTGITVTNGAGSITLSDSGVSDINTQTANYTLVLSDAGKIIEMNSASPLDLTVPLNSSVAFPIGTQIVAVQLGAGATTIVATGGVTIRTPSTLILAERYAGATLYKRGTDEWVLLGYLQP